MHPELEEQRERAEARTKVLSASGRRGAEKRWAGVAKVADRMKPLEGHPEGHPRGGAIGRPSRGDSNKSRTDKKKTDAEAAPSLSPQGGRSARLNEKQPDGPFTPSDAERWTKVRADIDQKLQDSGDVEKTGES